MNNQNLKVGLVGTGYVAAKRVEALQQDDRVELVAISGHDPKHTQEFCQTYSLRCVDSWQNLVDDSSIDLLIISNINSDHAPIARAALLAGKNVVVEYPLAFTPSEAQELIDLAHTHHKLLHGSHIELLGGLHQAIRQHLTQIGNVFFARYTTIHPQQPIENRWTYNHQQFGFPLVGALSRIHRFTDLFGQVAQVNCQSRFWNIPASDYYTACLCHAQLRFQQGLIADITYGKGDIFTHGDRSFILYGHQGCLIFQGEKGTLIQGETETAIEVTPRRGLFAQDTKMVVDHLLLGTPLYVTPTASLQSLIVANSAWESAVAFQA